MKFRVRINNQDMTLKLSDIKAFVRKAKSVSKKTEVLKWPYNNKRYDFGFAQVLFLGMR